MKLSVLMPVFNESRTLRTIVDRVLLAPIDLEMEIVCVDDGSKDDSWEILQDLASEDDRIRAFRHDANRGKGAAIRTAIAEMTGDIAVVQDSDLEYDPQDFPVLLRPILDGRADAVYGSRFASSSERRVLMFWHSLGNKLLTALSNMVNDLNLTDMETCYKAVRTDILSSLRLQSDRFGIEPEITTRLAQWGARIYEVPISYHGRTYAEGKSIGWRDGLQAIWLILKYRFLDTQFAEEEQDTRHTLGKARMLRRWMLDEFRENIGDRVLIADAGPGGFVEHLLAKPRLVAIDSVPSAIETLRRRFGHLENVRFEVGSPREPRIRKLLADEGFDSVICFEGLQRAQDPLAYLEGMAGLVGAGGTVLIQVPQNPDLFGETDRRIGHRRRFSRTDISGLVSASGLDVVRIQDWNRLGAVVWRLHNIIGLDRITSSEVRAFNALIPLARRFDNRASLAGLSLLIVATKRC